MRFNSEGDAVSFEVLVLIMQTYCLDIFALIKEKKNKSPNSKKKFNCLIVDSLSTDQIVIVSRLPARKIN